MTWTDYKVPTIMVPDGQGTDRPVRGLALEDLTDLITRHLDTMMEITTIYIQSQKNALAGTNMTDLVMLVAKEFPAVLSEVISMVTDTPELKKMRLPSGLQYAILDASVRLTIQDAGGLGNLSAMLQNVVNVAIQGRGEASRKLAAILSGSSTSAVGRTPTS